MVPSAPSADRRSATLHVSGCLALAALLIPLGAVAAPPGAIQTADPGNATVAYDGDRLVLETAPGQVVTGRTELSEGSRVVVRIEAGGERPFVLSRPATVGPDGGFEARFDLSARRPASNATVSVLYDSRLLVSAPAEIVAAGDGPTRSPTTAATTREPTTAGSGTAEPPSTRSAPGTGSSPTPDSAPFPRTVGGVPLPFAALLAIAAVVLLAVLLRGR